MAKLQKIQNTEKFGREIGLGKLPNEDIANAVLQCGMTQLPVIEYVTWTANIPMSDDDVDATFGEEIDVLDSDKSVRGVDSVDSSFAKNGILQNDMLVMGFGVHLFGEPLAFSTIGNSVANDTAFPTMSPDVWTEADLARNALGVTEGVTPSTMQWGNVDWEALWHLANGYQFQWKMNQKYLVVNELVADVCYFGPYADAVAASSSEEALQPFVRRMNDRYRTVGGSTTFEPINARRIGSVNTFPGSQGGQNVGVFHPTRDFDTVPTTYGGIRNQGATGCCMPFRKLPRPVLCERGIPIWMTLQGQDSFHVKQMQNLLKLSGGFGGTSEIIGFDADINGITNNNAAAAATFLELTLDPIVANANTFFNQNVQTDRDIKKGGTLKLAILLKGVELWGNWKTYVIDSMQDKVAMPQITGTMAGYQQTQSMR